MFGAPRKQEVLAVLAEPPGDYWPVLALANVLYVSRAEEGAWQGLALLHLRRFYVRQAGPVPPLLSVILRKRGWVGVMSGPQNPIPLPPRATS